MVIFKSMYQSILSILKLVNHNSIFNKFKRFIKAIVYRLIYHWRFINLNTFINDSEEIERRTVEFCKIKNIKFRQYFYPILYEYYKNIINNHKGEESTNFDNEVKRCVFNILPQISEKSQVILLRLLIELKIVDHRIIRAYIDIATKTKDKELRYWLTLDVEKVVFMNNLEPYNEYYIDRKRLFKQIATENKLHIPQKSDNIVAIKRDKLCIVSYMLAPTIKNSVQRVVKMLIDGMHEFYPEILVITLDSFTAKSNCFIDSVRNYRESIKDAKAINKMFEGRAHVYYQVDGDYCKHMQHAIEAIYTFNPNAIIDITDEFSPISYIYSKDFPTYYIPLRGYTSSSFFSCFLTGNLEICRQINYKYQSVDQDLMVSWLFPEYRPLIAKPYMRSDYGFKDKDFILVTVGNPSSYSAEFYDSVCEIIKQYDTMKWILVGGELSDYCYSKYNEFLKNKKVIKWGYENNLAEFYHICDAFVNPNRTGSSGAIAIAAQQMIPIVTTNFPNDAMRWIGIENSVKGDYKTLMQRVIKLYSDKEYYNKQSKLFYELVNEASDMKTVWKRLKIIMEEYQMKNHHELRSKLYGNETNI